jgi:hypothetical protein
MPTDDTESKSTEHTTIRTKAEQKRDKEDQARLAKRPGFSGRLKPGEEVEGTDAPDPAVYEGVEPADTGSAPGQKKSPGKSEDAPGHNKPEPKS